MRTGCDLLVESCLHAIRIGEMNFTQSVHLFRSHVGKADDAQRIKSRPGGNLAICINSNLLWIGDGRSQRYQANSALWGIVESCLARQVSRLPIACMDNTRVIEPVSGLPRSVDSPVTLVVVRTAHHLDSHFLQIFRDTRLSIQRPIMADYVLGHFISAIVHDCAFEI